MYFETLFNLKAYEFKKNLVGAAVAGRLSNGVNNSTGSVLNANVAVCSSPVRMIL